MDFISGFAQGLTALFQAGGETLADWVTEVTPMVICLMTAISSIIKLIGEKRVENFTKKLTRFTVACYTLVPMLAVLFPGNPMCYTFGRFVGEKYKPAYYDSCVSFLYPVTDLFLHANPGELFVHTGVTIGITKLNLPLGDLVVCYFVVSVIVILIRGVLAEKIYFRPTSKLTKEEENTKGQAMHRKVKITRGSNGWGGSLVLEPNEAYNKILCMIGGGIHPVATKTTEMTEAETVDDSKTAVPDEQVLVAVVDCGGTARYGIYPKKRTNAANLVPVEVVEPLAQYITEDVYVSGVKEDTITFADEEVKAEKAVEEMKEPRAPKTKAQARKELVGVNQGKKPGIITRIDIGAGQVINKFLAAGRESIEMAIKNVPLFMAFTSTILGIIQVSGLGNIIANTISPLCSIMPGMIVISLTCGLPLLLPTLRPGMITAQMVGTLLGAGVGLGNIPAQYVLSALSVIGAQAGDGSVSVGLPPGEAEPETIESDVPAVSRSHVTIGFLTAIIAFIFSAGMH